MNVIPNTNEMQKYLLPTKIIDFSDEAIIKLANELSPTSSDEIEYIKSAYEYVRDNISHSADINNDVITCTASEVLKRRRYTYCLFRAGCKSIGKVKKI